MFSGPFQSLSLSLKADATTLVEKQPISHREREDNPIKAQRLLRKVSMCTMKKGKRETNTDFAFQRSKSNVSGAYEPDNSDVDLVSSNLNGMIRDFNMSTPLFSSSDCPIIIASSPRKSFRLPTKEHPLYNFSEPLKDEKMRRYSNNNITENQCEFHHPHRVRTYSTPATQQQQSIKLQIKAKITGSRSSSFKYDTKKQLIDKLPMEMSQLSNTFEKPPTLLSKRELKSYSYYILKDNCKNSMPKFDNFGDTIDDYNLSAHEDENPKTLHQWNQFLVDIDLLKHSDAQYSTTGSGDFGADVVGKSGEILQRLDSGLFKTFKSLLFLGIPMQLRAKIWMVTSGSSRFYNPGEFEILINDEYWDRVNIEEHEQSLLKSEKQIRLDCARTMRNNIFFKDPDGPGIKKLKNVLIGFIRKYPKVGYCQGMNLIVAHLLLIFISAQETFNFFENLVVRILCGLKYFLSPFKEIESNIKIVIGVVHLRMPQLHDFLVVKHEVNCGIFLFNWFLTILINVLPTEILFRVWDLIVCLDGEVGLMKIMLGIFKFLERFLITNGNLGERKDDNIYDVLINLKSIIVKEGLTANELIGLLDTFSDLITQEKLEKYRAP